MTEGPTAGWYDDPDHPDTKRYWDGAAWTSQRATKDRPSQVGVATIALGILVAAAALWFIYGVATGGR